MGLIDSIKPLATVLSSMVNKPQQHKEKNSWERRELNPWLLLRSPPSIQTKSRARRWLTWQVRSDTKRWFRRKVESAAAAPVVAAVALRQVELQAEVAAAVVRMAPLGRGRLWRTGPALASASEGPIRDPRSRSWRRRSTPERRSRRRRRRTSRRSSQQQLLQPPLLRPEVRFFNLKNKKQQISKFVVNVYRQK